MTEIHRRAALGLVGAGLALAAGCSDTVGDDGSDGGSTADEPAIETGDLPPYAAVLPETDAEEYVFGAIDVQTLTELFSDSQTTEGAEPTDPLVVNPVATAAIGYFGLVALGFSPSFDAHEANDETADGEGTLLYVDGTIGLYGAYDVDGLAADLEDAGYDVSTEGGYVLAVDDASGEAVGASDDLFAFASPNEEDDTFDPAESVERVVATAAGERAPKHEGDEAFEWLLRAGDGDGIVFCLHASDALAADELEAKTSGNETDGEETTEYALAAFDGARGVHQHLSVEGDEAFARAVVSYPDADAVDADRLEGALGTDADAVDVVEGETAVRLDAEYGSNVVEEQ
ncbi:hypothetical protein [Salinilacihabitans rarus]|uniref:hypothetical protein n=1 Tax=Salinilacihabitans rarus TaxID=2961596 RepID=UPI0020C8C3E2|nr:hypothetical protein [Salinilacihabitans rarus]